MQIKWRRKSENLLLLLSGGKGKEEEEEIKIDSEAAMKPIFNPKAITVAYPSSV